MTAHNSPIQRLAQEIIGGRNTMFQSPFGDKAICYADFTASGKSLSSIEQYIQQEVMELYGNTHTTASITGRQSGCFRDEAREIIARAVNATIAGPEAEDCVLFAGSGATSAAIKLVTMLGLNVAPSHKRKIKPKHRPVVFVGPFEHHSNLLPWRESCADIVQIPENGKGLVDLDVLRKRLRQFARRPLKIGTFSAASNLTGVLTDTNSVSALLHQHGALAFWDYASCAPYVEIDVNPKVDDSRLQPFVYKDAVFFSGHKFLGGPGSPGVLVIKKRLLKNEVPSMPGGGTVVFVTEKDHRYVSNREEREEGGTPDIIGSIRLGLAFEVKQRVGHKAIMQLEHAHVKRVREALGCNEKIVLLGRDGLDQLPIFSFLIRFGDRFLHYNFVCALLNDLFGIQTRGGCQCAGPYATRLLGISMRDVLAYKQELIDGQKLLRPGFSRVSFPYFMPTADVDYIIKAIEYVATDGWKFLQQYQFDHKSGTWSHMNQVAEFVDRKWLADFQISSSSSLSATYTASQLDIEAHRLDNFKLAKQFAGERIKNQAPTPKEMLDESKEALRWFVFPSEVVDLGQEAPHLSVETRGPVQPNRYGRSSSALRDAVKHGKAGISFFKKWRDALSCRSHTMVIEASTARVA